jgi:hypothetical protein
VRLEEQDAVRTGQRDGVLEALPLIVAFRLRQQ